MEQLFETLSMLNSTGMLDKIILGNVIKDEVPDGSLKIIDFGSDWLHFGRGLKNIFTLWSYNFSSSR